MKKCGPFDTFQHKTIIRNQFVFMNHSQYPVKSSKDTFYVQDTFVSLEGLKILPLNGFFLMSHRPWFGTTSQIFKNFEQRYEILIKIFYFWWNLQWNKSRPYLWTCPTFDWKSDPHTKFYTVIQIINSFQTRCLYETLFEKGLDCEWSTYINLFYAEFKKLQVKIFFFEMRDLYFSS